MRTAVSGRDLKERYLNTRGIRRQTRDEALLDFLFERPARPHSAPGQRTPYSSASLPRRARRFRFLNALASGVALACIAATCAGHFLSRQSCAAESSTPPSWYLERKGGRDRPLGSWPLEPVRFAPPWPLGLGLGLAKLGCGGEDSKDRTWERVASKCQRRPHCSRISAPSIRAAGALLLL